VGHLAHSLPQLAPRDQLATTHDVHAVDHRAVAPAATADHVAPSLGGPEQVSASSAQHPIWPGAAAEFVASGATVETVCSRIPLKSIGSGLAQKAIGALASAEAVRSAAADQAIGTGEAEYEVVSSPAEQLIAAPGAPQFVLSGGAELRIGAGAGVQAPASNRATLAVRGSIGGGAVAAPQEDQGD
jgi:hypothetical protein